VGAMRAGVKSNIIPADAELLLSLRTFDPAVREAALAAIRRIVAAEAAASGAPKEPEIVFEESFPALDNDSAASERTRVALDRVLGAGRVVDPGVVTGSEDVGMFASAAGVPLVYWLLGGADPALFAGAGSAAELERIAGGLPSNHSPFFAPVIEPTLSMGVTALVTAAREWMPAK